MMDLPDVASKIGNRCDVMRDITSTIAGLRYTSGVALPALRALAKETSACTSGKSGRL
jgi:hypothetical protein